MAIPAVSSGEIIEGFHLIQLSIVLTGCREFLGTAAWRRTLPTFPAQHGQIGRPLWPYLHQAPLARLQRNRMT